MKKIIAASLLLMLSTTLVVAQEVPAVNVSISYGYLSYNDVLKAMPGYEQAQKEIATLRSAYEAELKRSEEQFSRAYADYVEGGQNLPENILLKRQNELQQLMEQAMKFKQEAKLELEKKEHEVMQPLIDRLNDVLHNIGMDRGYAFILNTDNGSFPFINGAIGTDVTADVLGQLK